MAFGVDDLADPGALSTHVVPLDSDFGWGDRRTHGTSHGKSSLAARRYPTPPGDASHGNAVGVRVGDEP